MLSFVTSPGFFKFLQVINFVGDLLPLSKITARYPHPALPLKAAGNAGEHRRAELSFLFRRQRLKLYLDFQVLFVLQGQLSLFLILT